MAETLCFAFKDYRDYLEARLPTKGAERGLRSRLAEAMRCQSSFISRVIAREAHFNPDHAIQVSEFLSHSELEGEYFLLLVLESRAGTRELVTFYRKKQEDILEKKDLFTERTRVKESLSNEEQMTYYSAWYYSAIHVLLTIPALQTQQAISRHLQVPLIQVERVLKFLESVGLAELREGRYITGKARIHLGKGSPMLSKHHSNWRMRAIQALDQGHSQDLFFSGPVSFSEASVEIVREKIFRMLGELEPIFQSDKEERTFCLNLDFFHL